MKSKTKSISVIIPVYNTPHNLLEENIKTMMGQKGEFEFLFINDGSTDPYIDERLSLLAGEDCRVTYIKKENTGVSDTRNVGIERSNGEYVLFVDSDDTMTEGAFDYMLHKSHDVGADIAIFGCDMVKCDKHISKIITAADKPELLTAVLAYRTSKYSNMGILIDSPCARLFKREMLLRGNIRFDKRIFKSEDAVFDAYAYQFADNIYIDNRPVYNYVFNEKSVCHTYSYRHIEVIPEIIKVEEEFVEKFYKYDKRFRDALAIRTVVALMDASHAYFSRNQSDKSFFDVLKEYCQLLSNPIIKKYVGLVSNEMLANNELTGVVNFVKLFLYKHKKAFLDMLILRAVHLFKK